MKLLEKIKVKLSLCLSKYHAMKTYWESGSIVPCVLNLGTKWRRVVSLTLRQLSPGEEAPIPIGQEAGWVPEPVSTRG
jgi:hypothetical protein